MRKTIGTNPLDAVVPNLTAPQKAGKPTNRRTVRIDSDTEITHEPIAAPPAKVTKERLTIHISVPLIERAKNAVFWTPGLTLADLGERALEALVTDLEKENGGPYQPRPHELKGGRPMK
jgi:UDP-N-acetylglucosamine enolpyruvyl transferase